MSKGARNRPGAARTAVVDQWDAAADETYRHMLAISDDTRLYDGDPEFLRRMRKRMWTNTRECRHLRRNPAQPAYAFGDEFVWRCVPCSQLDVVRHMERNAAGVAWAEERCGRCGTALIDGEHKLCSIVDGPRVLSLGLCLGCVRAAGGAA